MSKYKWYILILATATRAFVSGAHRMCLPPLFPEILADLGISKTQMGTIWGLDPLAGIFVSLISGLLIDRFGIKRTLTVVCFLAGIIGASRGLSTDFISMAATMFAFGAMVAMIPTLATKAGSVWFVDQHLALATGILALGVMGGSMIGTMMSATVFSPLLGGWSNVLFLYSVPSVLLGILWWATGREPTRNESGGVETSHVPLREVLPQVIRLKGIWGIGFIFLCTNAAYNGLSGYLPTYLEDIGWATAAADGALTAVIGAMAVSTLPASILSEFLGSRKKVLIPSAFIVAASLGVIPLVDGATVWVLLVINGVARGCIFPLLTALTVEQKGVGPRYAGTAVGLTISLGMLGGFIGSPLGMGVTDAYGGSAAFFTWSAISFIALAGFFLIREKPKKAGKPL